MQRQRTGPRRDPVAVRFAGPVSSAGCRAPPAPSTSPSTSPDGPAPLRHRIADAVVGELRAGRLRPGDALPSTRAPRAASLGLSRGPVVAAYDELAAAGFVVSRAGSGAVVAPGADRAAAAGALTHVHTPRDAGTGPEPARRRPGPLGPAARPPRHLAGRPRRLAPRLAHRRLGRARQRRRRRTTHDRLRRVLAEHLRRSRGVAVAPDDLLLVPGVGASLRALPAALGLVGATVALEDPGYVEAWTAFATEGVRVAAVPVDDDGLDPALLPRGTVAAYVTPSHQYPLGARMPVTRRVQLLEWAWRTGGLVLEDDYDGEFRYDVSPLPALRSLPGADEHVVYIGTASKLVAPSLRVAWMAPPRRLRDRLRVELESRGLVVNEATGLALAEFVASGALATHHARVARTYAARRAALVAAVARHLPGPGSRGSTPGCTSCCACPTTSTTSTSCRGWPAGPGGQPAVGLRRRGDRARAGALLRRAARDPGGRRRAGARPCPARRGPLPIDSRPLTTPSGGRVPEAHRAPLGRTSPGCDEDHVRIDPCSGRPRSEAPFAGQLQSVAGPSGDGAGTPTGASPRDLARRTFAWPSSLHHRLPRIPRLRPAAAAAGPAARLRRGLPGAAPARRAARARLAASSRPTDPHAAGRVRLVDGRHHRRRPGPRPRPTRDAARRRHRGVAPRGRLRPRGRPRSSPAGSTSTAPTRCSTSAAPART